MSDSVAFGSWLRQRRRALDLTQEDLGEKVGIAAATVRKFEAETRRPSREVAERLAQLLDLEPAERAAFVRAARAVREPVARAAPLASAAQPSARAALPAPITPFVGRERELAALEALLADPSLRLITLTGPGGVGKTRLALQAATSYGRSFAHGAYFAPLGAVGAPDGLAPAIAGALPLELYGADDVQARLLRYLAEQELLLVLDDVEHLLGDGGALWELLTAIVERAPGVKLLVTSRERLHVRGEWVIDLQGLPVPDDRNLGLEPREVRPGVSGERQASSLQPPASGIERYAAVALFLQQARRVNAGFTLSAEDRRAVVRICRLIEGLPLAIELAATWTRMLLCAEIAREIERGLDFLATSARDVPERHRSLRAVFDHSWNLLDDDEQAVLRRLSVFRGGFTRAAAAAVLSLDAANSKLKTQNHGLSPVEGSELLLLLAALVDKSLLRSGADGRYDMHELVRQHAADRLRADPGEEADARNRHCRYYAAWLRQREGALRGRGQRAAVAEIGAEIDNLRLAGEWAIDQGCLAELRQAIRPMGWFYEVRGWLSEGAALFRRLVDALDGAGAAEDDSGAERAIALGQALAGLGWFHFRQGRLDQAGDLLRACDAPQPLADALAYLGFLSCESGQYADARRFLAEGLALSTSAGDRWTAAFCQADLGKVAYQLGDYQEARRLLAESLEAWRALGDPRGQVCTSTALSAANIRVGDYGAARRLLQQALAGRGGQYDPWSLASTLDQFGAIALAQGDYAEADYLFREGLALFRSIDDRWHMAQALNHLGWSSRGLGLVAEARRYFREALDLALASRMPPAALEALVGLARDAAPDPALALLAFVAGAPSGGADVRARPAALRRSGGETAARAGGGRSAPRAGAHARRGGWPGARAGADRPEPGRAARALRDEGARLGQLWGGEGAGRSSAPSGTSKGTPRL